MFWLGVDSRQRHSGMTAFVCSMDKRQRPRKRQSGMTTSIPDEGSFHRVTTMNTNLDPQTAENVFSETIPKIATARSLTNRAFGERMCPYPTIGDLLRERASDDPDKLWLTYLPESGGT